MVRSGNQNASTHTETTGLCHRMGVHGRLWCRISRGMSGNHERREIDLYSQQENATKCTRVVSGESSVVMAS